MGNLAGTDFLLYPYANYSLAGTTNRFLVAGVSVEPAANFSTAMEIDHMMWFSGSYGAQEASGTTPQIYAKAFPVSFASASGEPIGGLLDVTVRGMTFPLALNGQYHFFDADPAGGTLDFGVSARTERMASGYGYQGVAISYGTVGKYCLSNYECASVSSLLRYCSPVGCHDGSAGKACSHDIQCNTASGYFCNSFGQCALGAVGDACAPDEGDCANGNACGISLMCQIDF
jgi:hypothetical protein